MTGVLCRRPREDGLYLRARPPYVELQTVVGLMEISGADSTMVKLQVGVVLNDDPEVGVGWSVERAGACRAAYIVTGGEDNVDRVDEGGGEEVVTGGRETVVAEEVALMMRGVVSYLASTPEGVEG